MSSKTVTVRSLYQAKTGLSALVDRAARGEEIVITKHGKPLAKLGPVEQRNVVPKRKPGDWKGKVWIADDFNDPLPDDLLYAFNEKPIDPPAS
jgi:prevent-host-death family protein